MRNELITAAWMKTLSETPKIGQMTGIVGKALGNLAPLPGGELATRLLNKHCFDCAGTEQFLI